MTEIESLIEDQKQKKPYLWHDFYMERFKKECLACPARHQCGTCTITNRKCRADDCFAKYWGGP